jgi:glutaredoxin
MKQQCYLAVIYLNWLLLAGGVAVLAWKGLYVAAIAFVALLPLAMWAYIRVFPSISRAIGYGEVRDEPAEVLLRIPTQVTLYTALGCPFCPIVKARLMALKPQMDISLREIDVTLKPDLLIAKGIRAVPVVEVGDRRLAGNATSAQLAELISGLVPSEPVRLAS